MNWSLIILGLVALSSAALAENSYLVIAPKLFKVGYDNQVSVFIAAADKPVEVKFWLTMGRERLEGKVICNAGETRNGTITIPKEFPIGAGELKIAGMGGLEFEERRDVIIYDNRHVLLIQTTTASYRPEETMEMRVIVTDENLIPVPQGELMIEIYDAALRLVGEFRRVPILEGLTDTLRYQFDENVNMGVWLVTATYENSTSSVEVHVSRPQSPAFDVKAIFPRFLLRTDKMLQGGIELRNDEDIPIFGRGMIAIGQITEQDVQSEMMKMERKEDSSLNEEWRKWKSQQIEIAGRYEIDYDLLSLFDIDLNKAVAVQIYIQVTDLVSGQERVIRHMIPVFTRDIVYDIRPLEFRVGMINEFEVIARRPDGKPIQMEDMIINVRMLMGDEQGKPQDEKSVEVREFYTRGRNDIGFFTVEIPESCIGVLMTLAPLSDDGKVVGYRTHAIPLMPTPRRRDESGAKLTIELLPSTVAPVNTDVNVPVVSSQISTVGRTSNFYIQVLPSKPVEKFERLPMSYILMTNGRITSSGEFFIEPTVECKTRSTRSIKVEEPRAPMCVFNGTLPIEMTRDMVPYSTLIVYTFQPSFGYHMIESYRFSVAGLFQSSLSLNATMVPYTPTEMEIPNPFEDYSDVKPIKISDKVQGRSRIELNYAGVPESTVGFNVFEYDGTLSGLPTSMTKERLLRYLTSYERLRFISMPQREQKPVENPDMVPRTFSEEDEERQMNQERKGYKMRLPMEEMFFGISAKHQLQSVEGDDIYTTSNMGRLYGEEQLRHPSGRYYRRKLDRSMNQYDITVGENNRVMVAGMPIMMDDMSSSKMPPREESPEDFEMNYRDEPMHERPTHYGSKLWYEKMHTKLNDFSREAFMFMQSGLTIVSDFDTLRIPTDMKRENLSKMFSRFRENRMSMLEGETFTIRDEARRLLEDYMFTSNSSMLPPPIMLDEQSRGGYYRSIFFHKDRIGSEGTGKVVLPKVHPYATWMATGFALNPKSGLAIAQPVVLPRVEGVFVLGNCPQQVRREEHVLLTYGINNYFKKDLTNVVVRIRASPDFELREESKPEEVISMKDKDYTYTIPSLKSYGFEIRNMIFVPKAYGPIQIVIEVESEMGGDYEVLTVFVREAGIKRKEKIYRLYDLTMEKKSYGPIVEKLSDASSLRRVRLSVTGTGLDYLVEPHTYEMKALVGIDRALVRLYRAIGFRRYLNETSQMKSRFWEMTTDNATTAYQRLQRYGEYDGSYSMIPDEGRRHSSLYYTSLAFGAMVSPYMPFHDYVRLNRTLDWILSHQQEDGSFYDDGPCYHYRFCAGEFRRESLTALVLYSLTRDNAREYMPEFMRHRLYNGENSPIKRAHQYLFSRVEVAKPHYLLISLFEMAFIQNREILPELQGKIREALLSRQLTVMPEHESRYLKFMEDPLALHDQVLLNAMTLSLYRYFDDHKMVSDIGRWFVREISSRPYYDDVFDGIFRTEAWLSFECSARKRFEQNKFDIIVDVSADNGEKRQFKVDLSNIDVSQMLDFTLPVREITYKVSGYGVCEVHIDEYFYENKEEMKSDKEIPFELTHEYKQAKWYSDIAVKTCMTYKPTARDEQLAKDNYIRPIVIDFLIPSGVRVDERSLNFFLSRVPEVMTYTYEICGQKLSFFLNIPSTSYRRPICLDWALQRLSTVMNWSPMQVRVYDYLRPEVELVYRFPMKWEPMSIGYTYVDAIHEKRPTMEEAKAMAKRDGPWGVTK